MRFCFVFSDPLPAQNLNAKVIHRFVKILTINALTVPFVIYKIPVALE